MMGAIHQERPLLMYMDSRFRRGKTLLMKVITAAVRAKGKIVLCTVTMGLAALSYEGGTTGTLDVQVPSHRW